jgi:uncharacterized membrane protein YidH (DUF202 family)
MPSEDDDRFEGSDRSDPSAPPGYADRSLAAERTQLAWNRSGLAVVVVVAILVRRLWPLGSGGAFALLVVVAAGSLAWAAGMLLVRGAGHEHGLPRLMGTTACRMLTAGTVALAAAGVLLTVWPTS